MLNSVASGNGAGPLAWAGLRYTGVANSPATLTLPITLASGLASVQIDAANTNAAPQLTLSGVISGPGGLLIGPYGGFVNSDVAQIGPESTCSAAATAVVPHVCSSFRMAQSRDAAPRSPTMPGCRMMHGCASQIDRGMQVVFDPRTALFFPEKRPFFLEGAELFSAPNNLIYTRRMIAPVAASKLTGTVAGTSVAPW